MGIFYINAIETVSNLNNSTVTVPAVDDSVGGAS